MRNRSEELKSQLPGLYVHVPFCKSKCPYCSFKSSTQLDSVTNWLDGIEREAQLYREHFTLFDTLYLGGGTPSLLSGEELARLLESLNQIFQLTPLAERTMELNPDDVTREKLKAIRDLGINRLSLGVQSFDERTLQFLQRRHTAAKARDALELIRQEGFENVGLDLMYGFEEQTDEDWIRTLDQALEFHPQHISCYSLTIEEGTPFGRLHKEGHLKGPGEDRERTLFLEGSQYLRERGYIHYEISNFAKGVEHESRHNLKYWQFVPYLGLGPAAHSFQNGVRWWNTGDVNLYCSMLSKGLIPVEEQETLSEEQIRLEQLLLGFRTRRGVHFELLSSCSGWEKVVAQLEGAGLVRISDDFLIPTNEGFLVADSLPLLFCN